MKAVRDAFAALAPLFRYPDASFPRLLEDARRHFHLLDPFAREIADVDLPPLQSTYTSTFDLAPSCSPYLGVHLFGEESRDRARLMLGLRMSYRKSGPAPDENELPDHIAEVLRFTPYYETEVWHELQHLVLAPALEKMSAQLQPTSNPYRHLVAAAATLAKGEAS